jgi:transposase InsO family protein
MIDVAHPLPVTRQARLLGFKIREAGHVWSTDITHLPLARGFCYLTAVMDSGEPASALLAAFEHA